MLRQCNSTFDRASRHSRNDLPLEKQEHNERQNRNDEHIREEQVPLGGKLAHEAEQCQLYSDVLCTRQEVERTGEIVVDAERGGYDHCDDDWLQKRQNNRKEYVQRRRAIYDGSLIEFPRDRRHKGTEDQDRKGHGIGDLYHNQAEKSLVDPEPLQKEDRRHNGWWNDQPCQHDRTDDRRHPILTSLQHEGDKR